MKPEKSKHDELCNTAIRWLFARNCGVFAQEVPTRNGVADALGIITTSGKESVYYIEAKASRSDLICEKQKAVYQRSISYSEGYCNVHVLMKTNKRWKQTYGEEHIQKEIDECGVCQRLRPYDMNIDFYYLIVADGVNVEKELYPEWGVINEKGQVIRRAKRMKRTEAFDWKHYLEPIAHVLVYKAFGKMYMGEEVTAPVIPT